MASGGDLTEENQSESKPEENYIKFYEDLETVLDYFIDNDYKEFILIGASLGGRIISLIDTKKYNKFEVIL